jgi:hypothetical protein
VAEAVVNRQAEGYFGAPGRDPHELGRLGGIASGASRRAKAERQLEERVIGLRNGWATYLVLRDRRERERARERELYKRDAELAELDTWLITTGEHLDDAREQLRLLDEQIEERERRLEVGLTNDELGRLLSEIGERRVAQVVERLGWYDNDEAEQ